MTVQPFSMTVFEERPGSWRLVFCNGEGAVLASSRLYASIEECLHNLAMMQLSAPAFG